MVVGLLSFTRFKGRQEAFGGGIAVIWALVRGTLIRLSYSHLKRPGDTSSISISRFLESQRLLQP